MASPIVNKVLDRIEGEKSLNILESNFNTSRPKLWARAKELAEERYGVIEHHQKDADGNTIPHEEIEEAATTRIPAQNGNVYELMYSWRGKSYFCKMFFPQPGKPSKDEVQAALTKVYPSAILRNCYISSVNYGDPYIHAGAGDGFTDK